MQSFAIWAFSGIVDLALFPGLHPQLSSLAVRITRRITSVAYITW